MDKESIIMGKKLDLYKCSRCGNIALLLSNAGVPLVCCHEEMKAVEPNTTDAAQEKHVPVISREGAVVTVSVGSTMHPMTEEHSIQWIAVVQGQNLLIKWLSPDEQPVASFSVKPGQEITVYEYCNLHGVWSAKA